MTDRELMQQALGALEEGLTMKKWRELVAALRERLAQPEQEPVHYGPSSSVFGLAEMILSDCGCSSDYQPLLTRVAARIMGYIDTPPAAQRTWVGLTKDDINEIWKGEPMLLPWDMTRTLAIEQRLKEKNT